jgi:hypothetical protein
MARVNAKDYTVKWKHRGLLGHNHRPGENDIVNDPVESQSSKGTKSFRHVIALVCDGVEWKLKAALAYIPMLITMVEEFDGEFVFFHQERWYKEKIAMIGEYKLDARKSKIYTWMQTFTSKPKNRKILNEERGPRVQTIVQTMINKLNEAIEDDDDCNL